MSRGIKLLGYFCNDIRLLDDEQGLGVDLHLVGRIFAEEDGVAGSATARGGGSVLERLCLANSDHCSALRFIPIRSLWKEQAGLGFASVIVRPDDEEAWERDELHKMMIRFIEIA